MDSVNDGSIGSKESELQSFLRSTGKLVHYVKGEVIVRADDPPEKVYYIEKGLVKVYSINDRGEEYIHIIYAKHEMFPLAWLVAQKSSNTFYSAMTDCDVWRIPHDAINEVLKTDIEVTHALLEKAVLQFRIYATRVDNLQYKYARERLIYALLFGASRLATHRSDGSYIFKIPITQQGIANSINMSREGVSREFERLKAQGLIAYEGANLVINDWNGLSKEFKTPLEPDWWGLREIPATT